MKVGGMMYIGSAPEAETIPEHDAEINLSQIGSVFSPIKYMEKKDFEK